MLLGVSAPFEVPSFLPSFLPSLHVSPAAAACTMRARCAHDAHPCPMASVRDEHAPIMAQPRSE